MNEVNLMCAQGLKFFLLDVDSRSVPPCDTRQSLQFLSRLQTLALYVSDEEICLPHSTVYRAESCQLSTEVLFQEVPQATESQTQCVERMATSMLGSIRSNCCNSAFDVAKPCNRFLIW